MAAFIKSDVVKGIVAIVAAIIMYYSPESIDKIIEILLGMFGISTLVITEKH